MDYALLKTADSRKPMPIVSLSYFLYVSLFAISVTLFNISDVKQIIKVNN